MLKKVLLAGLVAGLALAIPMSQDVAHANQAGGKTQIANSDLKSETNVKSQYIQGRDNSVQAGGINVAKGSQIGNSSVKDETNIGQQGVRGNGNEVQTGGVNIGQ
ncbi:MAG: hypothetical protein C6I01_05300 [Epsilonproteobacteria bacterium]|jgi:hypothetical protein|nr:hypothetical protein [Campylobacterota bacterium]NPA88801.1 hypothetical protein [Campylobacterota bacterium]